MLTKAAQLLILWPILLACGGTFDSPSTQLPVGEKSEGSPGSTPSERRESIATYAVESDGSTIYFGSGPRLIVLDAADAGQTRLLAKLDLPGIVRDLDLAGALLAAACGEGGVVMIDVADRSEPRIISAEVFPDRAEGVALASGRAFVAARSEGVTVFDITDHGRLAYLGRFETDEQAVRLAARGDFVFVAASFGGMRVLDIADPTRPREIGFADREAYDMGDAVDVTVEGKRVYVANAQIGLRVVDIARPDEPLTQSIYPLLHAPSGLAVEGSIVFVADQDQGLHVVDAADPVRPQRLATLALPGRATDLALIRKLAYVAAAEGGVWIVDVRNPERPRTIGSFMLGQSVTGLDAAGDLLVLNDRLRGIRAFDGLRSGRLQEKAVIGPGTEHSVFVGESYLAACQGERLVILDLSDPGTPREVAGLPVKGKTRALALAEDRLLLVASDLGLQLVDLNSALRPRLIGTLSVEKVCSSFAPEDRIMESPVFACTIWSVSAVRRTAFLACDEGLAIVDLADPSRPEIRGRLRTPERVLDIEIGHGMAFLSCDDGVRIVDVNDSSMPREVGSFKSPGFVRGSAVRDDRLFAIDLEAGLLVLDIADPVRPRELVQLGLRDRPLDLKLTYPFLSIATGMGGLEFVDVSDPLKPRRLQFPEE